MRIHESGIDRNPDTTSTSSAPIMPSPAHNPLPGAPTATSSITLSTSCTPTMLSPTQTPSPSTPTTTSSTLSITGAHTDNAELPCPHCPLTFTSRIVLVGHVRIHRTETGGPLPGAPTHARRIRRRFPHCTRTFISCSGLLGHMRVRKDLR
ncbi:hypothetical protein SprV_0200897100 [Sparganum proliferum]